MKWIRFPAEGAAQHSRTLVALVALTFIASALAGQATFGNEKTPLKVFILAGQSNMQGHAHVRTFDAMRLNPQAAPLLQEMIQPDGTPRVCDRVWISSIGSSENEKTGRLTVGFGADARGPKIGPEFTFGIFMEKLLDEPILIIKTAWGGKSLHTDFRPPSAGPYAFNASQLEAFRKQNKDIEKLQAEKVEATGHYYRQMIDHVKHVLADIPRVDPQYDPNQGYELAGFVWFQGWNDMVDGGVYPNRDQPGGYDPYSELLAQFIRDVRKDLSAPELPVVIGVMGVGGPTAKYGPDERRYRAVHQNFRDAMAAPASLPDFQDNVAVVLTENYWDMEVVRLREIEKTLQPKLDELRAATEQGKLTRAESQEASDKLYGETFNEQELKILKESTSNFDFHYMGSAGIMAQIGKGFAEAMAQLRGVESGD